jgi:hypothetical protein
VKTQCEQFRSISVGGPEYRWMISSPDGYLPYNGDSGKKRLRYYDLGTMLAITPSEVRLVIEASNPQIKSRSDRLNVRPSGKGNGR